MQISQVLDAADPKTLAEMGIGRKNGGLVLDETKLEVDKLSDKKAKITETVNRQAAMLAQQYALAGAGVGGSAVFGNGQVRPMSLFDYLA